MSSYQSPLVTLAASPMNPQKDKQGTTWFEALADAWGQALDRQADQIQQKSDALTVAGDDSPSAITSLTSESLKMSFLSNSSHTSISTVGQALETMARKQ